jgi:hypothetical protein
MDQALHTGAHGALPLLLRQQEEGGRRGRPHLSAAADALAFSSVRPLAALHGHRQAVIHLQFVPVSAAASAGPSAAAARLFSACADGLLRLWSVHADAPGGGSGGGGGGGGGGECVALVRGPAELSDTRALAAGTLAACCGFDGGAALYDLVAGRACREFAHEHDRIEYQVL